MQDLTGQIDDVTSLSAAQWNQLPREVQNVITRVGIGLSASDLDQLGKAIAAYVGASDFYRDVGTTNAYVLQRVGQRQSPAVLVDGLRVRWRPLHSSTGASTINVAGLGVKPLVREDGTPTVGNDIVSTRDASARYDLSGDRFFLQASKGSIGQGNGAKVSLSTADLPSSSIVSWDGSVFDDDEWFSAGNPTVITVPSGVTRVSIYAGVNRLVIPESARGYSGLIRKNGSDFDGAPAIADFLHNAGAPNFHHSFTFGGDIEVIPGDELSLWLFGATNTVGSQNLLRRRPESLQDANWLVVQAVG